MAAKKRTLTLKSDIRGAVAPKVKDGHTRNPLRGAPVPGRNEVMYIGEPGSDPSLRRAIAAELAELAAATIKHHEAQRQKAKKPRGAGDDRRTTREVIADVVRQHRGETPEEMLPHVHSAMDANGMKPITDKHAKAVIAQESKF